MARLFKVKNKEDRLLEKKKVRHLFTFDRLLMITQTVAIVLMCFRYFSVI